MKRAPLAIPAPSGGIALLATGYAITCACGQRAHDHTVTPSGVPALSTVSTLTPRRVAQRIACAPGSSARPAAGITRAMMREQLGSIVSDAGWHGLGQRDVRHQAATSRAPTIRRTRPEGGLTCELSAWLTLASMRAHGMSRQRQPTSEIRLRAVPAESRTRSVGRDAAGRAIRASSSADHIGGDVRG
jgi:hypothetical protein